MWQSVAKATLGVLKTTTGRKQGRLRKETPIAAGHSSHPPPTPVDSNEPLLHAQLMASRICSSWGHSSHVMEGILPEPGRLSGHRSCWSHSDPKPLSWFLPGNKLLPREPAYHTGRECKMHRHSEKQAVFCKTGHTLTIEPRNLSLGYVSQRNEDYVHTKTCVWKIMTALFVMAPNWTDVLPREGQVCS